MLFSLSLTLSSYRTRKEKTIFGTPGLVREGFENEFEVPRPKQPLNNYPYFAATHNPTNFAIYNLKRQNEKNAIISKLSAIKPPGNNFTMEYGCRYSTISYKDNKYKYCGAWESNNCNIPN